jgi:hypothetical protein
VYSVSWTSLSAMQIRQPNFSFVPSTCEEVWWLDWITLSLERLGGFHERSLGSVYEGCRQTLGLSRRKPVLCVSSLWFLASGIIFWWYLCHWEPCESDCRFFKWTNVAAACACLQTVFSEQDTFKRVTQSWTYRLHTEAMEDWFLFWVSWIWTLLMSLKIF